MPTIIISNEDIAGKTILEQLKMIREFAPVTIDPKISYLHQALKTSDLPQKEQYRVFVLNDDHLRADFIEKDWNDDFFVFLSRHAAKSGIPSLTVHFTGNWTDETKFGGKPRQLSKTFPSGAKFCFLKLHQMLQEIPEFRSLNFEITYEVTHHGPLLVNIPSFFLELGSELSQWTNQKAARALALVADEIARKDVEHEYLPFLGIGGTHYAEKFNKIARNTEYAPAHIIPKYLIEKITLDILQQALERNPTPLEAIIIDHSGTNSRQRKHVMELLEHIENPPPILKAKTVFSK